MKKVKFIQNFAYYKIGGVVELNELDQESLKDFYTEDLESEEIVSEGGIMTTENEETTEEENKFKKKIMKLFSLEDFKGIYNVPLPSSEEGVTSLDSELTAFEKKALEKILGSHVASGIFSYIDSDKSPIDSNLDLLLNGGDYLVDEETKTFIGIQDLENSPVKDLIYHYWLEDDQGNSLGFQTTQRKQLDFMDLSEYKKKYISSLIDKIGDINFFFKTNRFTSDDNGCLYDFVKTFADNYKGFKVSSFETIFTL